MTTNNEEDRGISLLIDLLNAGEFNIIVDMNKPDETACKSFAILLTLLETGKIYEIVIDEIKKMLLKNNKDVTKVLELIFEFKKNIDSNVDIPVVLPREVFKRGS